MYLGFIYLASTSSVSIRNGGGHWRQWETLVSSVELTDCI